MYETEYINMVMMRRRRRRRGAVPVAVGVEEEVTVEETEVVDTTPNTIITTYKNGRRPTVTPQFNQCT